MSVRIDLPPPPVVLDRGGGGSGWVKLAIATDDIDAHLLVGRLNEAGIETMAVKDRTEPGSWLFLGGSNPWAPVVIMVRPLQLEDARLVLAEISYDAPAAEPPPPRVPRRGWSISFVWWVTALGLGILLSFLALLQVAQSFPVCPALPFCSESEARP
jgi:hypothetical protein